MGSVIPATDEAAQPVSILLCTFRGANYLQRQLETIVDQTHKGWRLFVSDDGSDDGTMAILERCRLVVGDSRMAIFRGPGRGFAANFFSLINRSEVDVGLCAFTDQDDEWDSRKLERAIGALSRVAPGVPAIYGSRSQLIDASGNVLGLSRLSTKPPSFPNALVQNIVSGNTMVLNGAAVDLMRRAGEGIRVSAHDWWAYLLITGSGGTMIYDTYPTIRYRQHGSNLYGSNVSFRAKLRRAMGLFTGDFRRWNSMNIDALHGCWELLSIENRRNLKLFEEAREGSLIRRLAGLRRSRVYRQSWDGQLALFVAAFMNRL